MRPRIQIPAVLTEHEIVADVERWTTDAAAVLPVTAPAVSLARHVAGKLGFVKFVGAD